MPYFLATMFSYVSDKLHPTKTLVNPEVKSWQMGANVNINNVYLTCLQFWKIKLILKLCVLFVCPPFKYINGQHSNKFDCNSINI
jgi:hypothetical protein